MFPSGLEQEVGITDVVATHCARVETPQCHAALPFVGDFSDQLKHTDHATPGHERGTSSSVAPRTAPAIYFLGRTRSRLFCMPHISVEDAYAVAHDVRPFLTKLYVAYFRISEHSDLTGPQLSIMERLISSGPMRISQLAHEEGIRMPTASNTLHQLEQRDLIRRVRDENDRRGVQVEMTEEGVRQYERVAEERTKYVADMLATLDEESLPLVRSMVPLLKELSGTYNTENIDH